MAPCATHSHIPNLGMQIPSLAWLHWSRKKDLPYHGETKTLEGGNKWEINPQQAKVSLQSMAFPAGKEPSCHSTFRAQSLHPARATSTGINQEPGKFRGVWSQEIFRKPQQSEASAGKTSEGKSGVTNLSGHAGFLHSQQGFWSLHGCIHKLHSVEGGEEDARRSSTLLAQHKSIPILWWDGGCCSQSLAGGRKQLKESRDSF